MNTLLPSGNEIVGSCNVFSHVCLFVHGDSHVTTTDDALYLTVSGPLTVQWLPQPEPLYMEPHCTGGSGPDPLDLDFTVWGLPGSNIWWPKQKTCSKFFYLRPPFPTAADI